MDEYFLPERAERGHGRRSRGHSGLYQRQVDGARALAAVKRERPVFYAPLPF